MADLRPEVLDAYGLVPALELHVRRLREAGALAVELQSDLDGRLPSLIEVLVYRLVQEALSNVRKHAFASRVIISLRHDVEAKMLAVAVEDDGVGFVPRLQPPHPAGHGVGLGSMVERCEGAGGSMEIESTPGKGTRLTFRIPVSG